VTAFPHKALAGGFAISSMGGRRSSSLVSIGLPDDPTALFHNPAGLADQKGVHLHFANAFYLVDTNFKLKSLDPALYPEIHPPDCGTGSEPACPWPLDSQGFYEKTMEPKSYFGIVPYASVGTDMGFLGEGGEDVVTSLAIYLPAFYGGTLDEHAPTAYQMVEGHFAVGSATLGAGWRISRWLAVGASASYNFMRIAIKRRFSIAAALTPEGEPPTIEAQLGQEMIGDITMDYAGTDHGVGWGCGLLLTPLEWLNVGFNYQGATSAKFEGSVSLSARDTQMLQNGFEIMGYKMPKRLIVQMPVPHSVQAGLGFKPSSWLEIGVDLRMWMFQVYEQQKVTPIYDPNDPDDEPMTEDDLSQDKNYGMSYEVAAGFLVRPFATLPGLELMAGGSYDHSPIPDETFTIDNPSLSSINLAGGVRWAITPHWRVTLSTLVYVYLKRDITGSRAKPPLDGQGSGAAVLPAFEVEYTF
jgi:long-subunit fatty acid transport protein